MQAIRHGYEISPDPVARGWVVSRLVLVAVAGAVLVLPSAARGSVHPVRHMLLAGPVLAGPRVVWVEGSPTGPVAVRIARRSGRGRVVLRLDLREAPSGSHQHVAVSASPSLVALARSVQNFRGTALSPVFNELHVAVASGPFTRIARCEGSSLHPIEMGVSGRLLATVGEDCGIAGHIDVRDFGASPAPRRSRVEQQEGVQIAAVEAAGTYLAFDRYLPRMGGREVVVFDRSLGRDAYRLPAPARMALEGERFLQRDGTIAVTGHGAAGEGPRGADCHPERIAWASVASPRFRRVRAPACLPGIRVARGRVLSRHVGRRPRLALRTVEGRLRHLVRGTHVPHRYGTVAAFDWDGRRIARVTGARRKLRIRVATP